MSYSGTVAPPAAAAPEGVLGRREPRRGGKRREKKGREKRERERKVKTATETFGYRVLRCNWSSWIHP